LGPHARALLFRRFTDTNTYRSGSIKISKTLRQISVDIRIFLTVYASARVLRADLRIGGVVDGCPADAGDNDADWYGVYTVNLHRAEAQRAGTRPRVVVRYRQDEPLLQQQQQQQPSTTHH